MLTAESEQSKVAEGKAAGAKAWIVKPCQPLKLPDAVSKPALPWAFRMAISFEDDENAKSGVVRLIAESDMTIYNAALKS